MQTADVPQQPELPEEAQQSSRLLDEIDQFLGELRSMGPSSNGSSDLVAPPPKRESDESASEIAQIKCELEAKRQQVEATQQQALKHCQRLEDQQQEFDELRNELERQRQDLDNQRSKYDGLKNQLAQQCDRLKSQGRELVDQRAALERERQEQKRPPNGGWNPKPKNWHNSESCWQLSLLISNPLNSSRPSNRSSSNNNVSSWTNSRAALKNRVRNSPVSIRSSNRKPKKLKNKRHSWQVSMPR